MLHRGRGDRERRAGKGEEREYWRRKQVIGRQVMIGDREGSGRGQGVDRNGCSGSRKCDLNCGDGGDRNRRTGIDRVE